MKNILYVFIPSKKVLHYCYFCLLLMPLTLHAEKDRSSNNAKITATLSNHSLLQKVIKNSLEYQNYPSLVTAFLYEIKHNIYQQVQYRSNSQIHYGNSIASMPDPSAVYSLPPDKKRKTSNIELVFLQTGYHIPTDILTIYSASLRNKQNLQNMLFFRPIIDQNQDQTIQVIAEIAFPNILIEASSTTVKNFMNSAEQRVNKPKEYKDSLSQSWRQYVENDWPNTANIIQEDPIWTRDAFSFYTHVIQIGAREETTYGQDLHVMISQKALNTKEKTEQKILIQWGYPLIIHPFSTGCEIEVLCGTKPKTQENHQVGAVNIRFKRHTTALFF